MINFDRKQNYFGLRDHLDRFVEIIWKVINIAAKFSKRNCSKNGKLIRGFPAVPQAGRGEEEGLKLYQLCPQDEHHRHGGARHTQVRAHVNSTQNWIISSDIGDGAGALLETAPEEHPSQGAKACLRFRMDRNCSLMYQRAAYSLSRERKHFVRQ